MPREQSPEIITIRRKSHNKTPGTLGLEAILILQDINEAAQRAIEEPQDLHGTPEQIKETWEKNLKKITRSYNNRELQEYYKLGEAILMNTEHKKIQKKITERQYRKANKIYFAFHKNAAVIHKLQETQARHFYNLNQEEIKKISQSVQAVRLLM